MRTVVPCFPLGLCGLVYAAEKPADPTELRFYTGADGAFPIYEDDGNTYAYEKVARAIIPIRRDDKAGTLSIGGREGQFPGMLDHQTFQLVFVGDGRGAGIDPTARPDTTVPHDGHAVRVRRKQ